MLFVSNKKKSRKYEYVNVYDMSSVLGPGRKNKVKKIE
jgi:hypothetical protein